ncbi:MAG: tripartite tricarboxylate transporter TctB family protein [Burkholderiaceae bacterium]
MSRSATPRWLRAETVTAVAIFVAAALFLWPTAELPALSALLPASMLIALLVLSVALLVADQRKASAGEPAESLTRSPRRAIGAFLLIVVYALCVDFFGFYPSTAVFVPLIAWLFGYRDPRGLALATVIVLAAIYLIFSFAMAQEFPLGRLWTA